MHNLVQTFGGVSKMNVLLWFCAENLRDHRKIRMLKAYVHLGNTLCVINRQSGFGLAKFPRLGRLEFGYVYAIYK